MKILKDLNNVYLFALGIGILFLGHFGASMSTRLSVLELRIGSHRFSDSAYQVFLQLSSQSARLLVLSIVIGALVLLLLSKKREWLLAGFYILGLIYLIKQAFSIALS